MLKIELSDSAKNDLSDISAYTYINYGQNQTDNYIGKIFQKLNLLARNPGLGHKRQDVPDDFNVLIAGKHIVVYKVKNEILYIARILHSSMAIELHDIQ